MRTGDPKVFAAGDGAFGPSAIVTAMGHGHRAAYYIRAYPRGKKQVAPHAFLPPCRSSVAQDPLWEKLNREEPVFCGVGRTSRPLRRVRPTYDADQAKRQAARCLRCDAETGSADYNRRTRDHMHMMARTEPGDTERLRTILRQRLRPRDNPFPEDRKPNLDDVVFLAAGLTRLVIDPYREACDTATSIGRLTLRLPYLATGFDGAPDEVRQGLATALAEGGCAYVGEKPLDPRVPWFQLVGPEGKPSKGAAAVVYLLGSKYRAVKPTGLKKGQIAGLAVQAPALERAIPYALESGFEFLLLDGTSGIEKPFVELEGPPDLSVVRDAIKILRGMNREEDIALVYFGGLRSGTDVAKMLAMNANAGVFGVAMGLALGANIQRGVLAYPAGRGVDEIAKAGSNWVKGTVQETAIIARCTGKTNVHNLEPEDMRTITLATREALGIPLASGGGARDYF